MVYDEKVGKKIESLRKEEFKKGSFQGKGPKVVFDHPRVPYKVQMPQGKAKFSYQQTFVPPTTCLITYGFDPCIQEANLKWKIVEKGSGSSQNWQVLENGFSSS